VNLLKIGIIHIGAITEIIRVIPAANSDAYNQDHVPVYSKKNKTPLKTGTPITAVRKILLTASKKNVL